MKIGIIGAGNIGSILANKLAQQGHSVKISNSRGPETIAPRALETGAVAATREEAVVGAEVVIISVPLSAYASLAPILQMAPASAVIVDTGNYYPGISGAIEPLESGEAQAVWAQKELGRPVIKAWNAVLAEFLAQENPATAIPVAGDSSQGKEIVNNLVRDTGFIPVDGGTSADSWRQQPGSPAYCTNLGPNELREALSLAQQRFLAARRDLVGAILMDRAQESPEAITSESITALNRLVTAASYSLAPVEELRTIS